MLNIPLESKKSCKDIQSTPFAVDCHFVHMRRVAAAPASAEYQFLYLRSIYIDDQLCRAERYWMSTIRRSPNAAVSRNTSTFTENHPT